MMYPRRICISKNKLPMVQPGTRDADILPSSGSSMGSGLALDYRAIQVGDNSQISQADDVVEVNEHDKGSIAKEKVMAPINDGVWHRDEKIESVKPVEVSNSGVPEEMYIIHTTSKAAPVYTSTSIKRGRNGRILLSFDRYGKMIVGGLYYVDERVMAIQSAYIDNDFRGGKVMPMLMDEARKLGIAAALNPMTPDGKNFTRRYQLREHDVDDDITKGRGSFVGDKEEGFEFRHALGSMTNLTALIIKGNAKFIVDNSVAEEFYNTVSGYLCDLGFKVSFDVSETKNMLHDASLIIGHSNGLFKLNRYKNHAKLIAFGAIPEKATNSKIVFANHPIDESHLKKCHATFRYDYPIPEHFIFTDIMKETINMACEEIFKEAFPDFQQYNGNSQMYEQVNERTDSFTTPHFNMWNTYYTDDSFACKKCNFKSTIKLEFDRHLNEKHPKVSWLNLPQYSEPERYQQVGESPRNTMESEFNIFETYFTDDESIDVVEDDEDQIETKDELKKSAFLKSAVTYDSNQTIQDLIKIPQVKALIDQEASGFVEKIIVTNIGADVQQTQQQLSTQPQSSGLPPITLQPISGDPYGHMWTSEDPTTHQKKPLDRIVRIDRVTDQWGTLVTILHEIAHHRHPDWSESQVESEALSHANTVKQFLGATKNASGKTDIMFVKQSLHSMPVVQCDLADTYQKQVIGLQNYSSLRPQHGLLFTYSMQQPLTFWMGKVSFPIDIIFANQNNQIVKIYRNCLPNSTELYTCDKVSKVIEVVGSFCAFHDIDVGDHIFYADDRKESFTQYILERIKDIKLVQQKDLDMKDWNIKIVMKKHPDNRRFLRVSWTPEDYKMKKADILVNPNPTLIRTALDEMPLEKLIRHSLLHILAGAKNELPEDREKTLITDKLY